MFYYQPHPIALSLGPFNIRWYGLMYLAGFTAAWWLGRHRLRQQTYISININEFEDFLFYGIMGAVIGGRIGYVLLYQPINKLWHDPLYILRIWEAGMSFHGGLAGTLIATGWFAYRSRRSFFQLTDFLAPLTPIGLGLGRIGNFINGELWGRPTDWPWGMHVPCQYLPTQCIHNLVLQYGIAWTPPLHPSQLYEATLEGIVLFIILWTFSAKPRPPMATSGLFLIFYALFRMLIEFVRQPDEQLGYLAFGWFTMGQLLSLPMLIIGGLLFTTNIWKHSDFNR